MSKAIGRVKKLIIVSDSDIDECITGAFEGGSNYWLGKVKVKDNDYKGAK